MKKVFLALLPFALTASAWAVDCSTALVDFQNTVSDSRRVLDEAFFALVAADRTGDQALVAAANLTSVDAATRSADSVKKAKNIVIGTCNKSSACSGEIVNFQNTVSDGVHEMSKAFRVLSAAVDLGNKSLTDAANDVMTQITIDFSKAQKASKIKMLNACL